jgi:hypothetical protein
MLRSIGAVLAGLLLIVVLSTATDTVMHGLVIGTVGTWNSGPEFGPKWYPIAVALTAPPCTWIGGRLRQAGSPAGVR